MLIMIIILLLLEGKKEIPTIKVKPINTILLRKRNSNYYFDIKRKCHMKYTFHKAFVICCSWLPSVLFINISFLLSEIQIRKVFRLGPAYMSYHFIPISFILVKSLTRKSKWIFITCFYYILWYFFTSWWHTVVTKKKRAE